MSGVYIKGMEMPEGCKACQFAKRTKSGINCTLQSKMKGFSVTAGIGIIGRVPACPLVEVPDHGDLIDRETIVDSVCDGVCSCSECSFNQYPFDTCVLQTNLKKLKVVIRANREES